MTPNETCGLENPRAYHAQVTERIERTVYWTEPGLRITRLRLVSEPCFPFWDVSYCHGFIGEEPVQVSLPFDQLPKGSVSGSIIAYAKDDHLYAKGTGILGAISTLI